MFLNKKNTNTDSDVGISNPGCRLSYTYFNERWASDTTLFAITTTQIAFKMVIKCSALTNFSTYSNQIDFNNTKTQSPIISHRNMTPKQIGGIRVQRCPSTVLLTANRLNAVAPHQFRKFPRNNPLCNSHDIQNF